MALDEPKTDDVVAEDNGYKFCIEPQLLEKISGVTINYGYMGFAIEPEKPLDTGGGGCSACSVGGGCGSAN